MLRVRKYFRGSGRALALIFIASVIWLIFDMAALRLSFNEINAKLAREELFRRELGGSETWKRGSAPRGPGIHHAPQGQGVQEVTKLKGVFQPPGDELDDPFPLDNKVRFRQRKRVIKPIDFNTPAPKGVIGNRPLYPHPDSEGAEKEVLDARHVEAKEKEAAAKVVPDGKIGEDKEARAAHKIVDSKNEGVMEVGASNGLLEVNIVEVKDSGAAKVVLGVKNEGFQGAGAAKGIFDAKDIGAAKDVLEGKAIKAKEEGAVKDIEYEQKGAANSVSEAREVGSKQEGAVKSVLDAKEERAAKGVLEAKEEGAAKGVKAKDLGAMEEGAGIGVLEVNNVEAKDKEAAKDILAAKEQRVAIGMVQAKDTGAKDEGAAKGVPEVKDIGIKEEGAGKGVLETNDIKAKGEGVAKGAFEAKDIGDNVGAGKGVLEVKHEIGAVKGILEAKDVGAKEEEAYKVELEAKKAVATKDGKGTIETKELELKVATEKLAAHPKDNFVIEKLNVSRERSHTVVVDKVVANNSLSVHLNETRLQQSSKAMDKNGTFLIKDIHVNNSLDGFLGKSMKKEIKVTSARDVGSKLLSVNISSAIKADVENKQAVQQDKVKRAPGTGKHTVQVLDVTQWPRNRNDPGQFGRREAVPKDKEQEAKIKWKEGNFNVYLSDIIPLDRAIEDTRPKGCQSQLIHDDLPKTSIIICFVDEVWSTLLRSVFSVLNRSPPELVKEIILVDDFSTRAYLKEKLDEYMKSYPKVRILRLKERHGLIRARIAGANIATGDVLTFLDSHIECNVGWLEPLLEQVRVNRKKVACPVIEVISDKDMSYMTVDSFQRGIFSWPMNFGWKPIPTDVIKKNKMTEMDPIKCPVMAGGLFSIDKKYFYELGTYDPGLDVWGGENLEISFKIWMCGGEIEIIPCSRVGHIFRNDNPYSFPKDRLKTVERNLVRVAEVWLDDYKEIFYGHGLHLLQDLPNIGDLTPQIELRKKLRCKSFKWYLDNIFPDLDAPLVRASGVVMNLALGKCLSLHNSTVILDDCDASKPAQHFNFTWLKLIKQENLCIAPGDKDNVAVLPCDNKNNKLRWLHKSLAAFHPPLESHLVIESIPRATCLEFDPLQNKIRTDACKPSNKLQRWQFEQYFVP